MGQVELFESNKGGKPWLWFIAMGRLVITLRLISATLIVGGLGHMLGVVIGPLSAVGLFQGVSHVQSQCLRHEAGRVLFPGYHRDLARSASNHKHHRREAWY
jgi:hypothetical protein